MNKIRKNKLYFFHFAILCLLVLGVFQFAEEILSFKQQLYYALHPTPEPQETVTESLPMEPFLHEEGVWYTNTPLIYHGGGDIDGIALTNSMEAVNATLEKGHYFIELDFMFTRDGQLVCAHDWERFYPDGYIPTAEEFLSVKIEDRFTPLSAQSVVTIMRENPQMHLIIDTKEDNLYLVVAELVSLAVQDPEIVDRFIIQLYNGYEKPFLNALYPFTDSQYLLTMYKLGDWDPAILQTCQVERIFILTTVAGLIPDEDIPMLRELGFTIYEHTINDPEYAISSLQRGICGFYTDSMEIDDLEIPFPD